MFAVIVLFLIIGIIAFIFVSNLKKSSSFKNTSENIYLDTNEITREYVISRLQQSDLDANLRDSDTNISIKFKNKALGFIDFKKEIPVYGYPIARFTQEIAVNDERIVPFYNGSKYSIRNGVLKNEKFNIGIKNDSDLDLVIQVLKKLSK